jgi:hypothetical protein
MSGIVNEESTAYLTVDFLDGNGAAAVPATVRYWVHDCATGALVRGETSVSPAASVTITLAPSDNVVTGDRNAERLVTIIATYGADDQVTREFRYNVQNLVHVPPVA